MTNNQNIVSGFNFATFVQNATTGSSLVKLVKADKSANDAILQFLVGLCVGARFTGVKSAFYFLYLWENATPAQIVSAVGLNISKSHTVTARNFLLGFCKVAEKDLKETLTSIPFSLEVEEKAVALYREQLSNIANMEKAAKEKEAKEKEAKEKEAKEKEVGSK